MLIDAHAHIFRRICGQGPDGPIRGGLHGRLEGRKKPVFPPTPGDTVFTSEMLAAAMDWAGVDKAVLLQAPAYGGDNEYILESVRKYPDRFAAAAYIDPFEPNAADNYGRTIENNSWAAVKIEFSSSNGFCSFHKGAKLYSDDTRWLYRRIDREGKTLTLDLGRPGLASYQTSDILRIAQDYPHVQIVICHLGWPSREVERDRALRRQWIEQISLGRLPNVWFDYSALPGFINEEEYPFPSASRFVRHATELIGADKLLWGTDIPGLLTSATYMQHASMGRRIAKEYPASEKKMLYENALKLYWGQLSTESPE